MDDRQFDRWTRLLAERSRRDTLKVLAAGLTAAPLAALAACGALAQVAAEACGKDGDRCNDNGDCCSNFKCKNEKCRAKDNSGNCGKDGDCCSNFKCKNEKCRSKDSSISCGKDRDRCKRSSDCCNSFSCKNEQCRKD